MIKIEDEITLENEPEIEPESLSFEEIDSLMEELGKGEIFKKAKTIKKEHPDWDWNKCVKEAGKKLEEPKEKKYPEEQKKKEEKYPEEEKKKPEDYYKEKKSEFEEMIRNAIREEFKKKEKYPEPCEEMKKKKEEPEKPAKELALEKKVEELNEKIEMIRNKGFKTVRQPEELKETGITYLVGKDGSIMEDWAGYCRWK